MNPARFLEGPAMDFPSACPEIPVSDLDAALSYYRDRLGFNIDWSARDIGLAGLSRGATRLFMTTAGYRAAIGNRGPVLLWINLANREEVDALHAEWTAAGARIVDPPEAHDYNKLYEFFAEDIDGNHFRIFYDFAWEER